MSFMSIKHLWNGWIFRNAYQWKYGCYKNRWRINILKKLALVQRVCEDCFFSFIIKHYPLCTVTVKAKPPTTYALSFSVDGGNGSLTATLGGKPISTGAMVPEGKTVEFTAKDDDYAVEKLTVTPMDALIAGGKPGKILQKLKSSRLQR